jgi:murein endopeptidase
MGRKLTKHMMILGFAASLPWVLSACGGHSAFENSMAISDKAKLKMFKEPTDVLTPTTPESAANEYSVYKLVAATFGADIGGASVSAQVKIESTAGAETVDLVGGLRSDGTASLVDLRPLPDLKNRLVAEALCVDVGSCKKIILNVYYNVAGKTLKKQFSSDSLRVPAPTKPVVPPPVSGKIPGKGIDGDAVHPSEKDLPTEAIDSDAKLGDFVGAPRNEILIGHLWERSKTPELPDVLARADDPQQTAPSAISSAAPSQAKPKPSPAAPTTSTPADVTKIPQAKAPAPVPKETPSKPTSEVDRFVQRWLKRAKDMVKPPVPAPKLPPKKLVVVVEPPPKAPATALKNSGKTESKTQPPVGNAAPLQPAAPVAAPGSKPTAAPPVVVQPAPDQTLPKTQPAPAPVAPGREEKPKPIPEIQIPIYPFPPAKPITAALALDQKITMLEAHLAPLINLRDGGVSQGGYADEGNDDVRSSIVNASVLPINVPGLIPITVNRSAHYGSGMLVSFLENAATYLLNQLGLKLYIGDMSLKRGGSYGPSSSHNTHQNGLDADIAWIGIAHPLVDSALKTNGKVVDHFDYEKTWNFLRLAAKQEIVEDAEKSTAVSRVFMSPAVKIGFCRWAKQNNVFDDSLNSELMRLVRPVAGHYKHFHLSLKCSPHYPLCRNLAGPPPEGTGCPAN